jgi:hypothetical protein
MGWLSRIFKGSDHKVSEGHYYKDDSSYYLPSTSGVIGLLSTIHIGLEFFRECCGSCFDRVLNVGCLG